MKTVMMAAAMMTAIMLGTNVNAQPSLANGPNRVAGVGPGRPGGPAPRPGQPGGLVPVTSYQGKVVKWQYNDDSVFDGFYILNGSDSLLVKFPGHLGKQVAGTAKVGSGVNFTGAMESTPFGANEVRLVSLNDKMLEEARPNEVPPAEKFIDGKGKITSLRKGRDGMVNGLILDNKTLIKLPPHILTQMGNTLQAGSSIAYSGNQKSADSGEITLDNYTTVHAKTLTINGQQYLVR